MDYHGCCRCIIDCRYYLIKKLFDYFLLGRIGRCCCFLIRKFGLEWYVKRKMNEFPVQEIKGIRLGVQPHGLIMRQKMGAQEGVGAIGWKKIFMNGYNTPDFC